MQIFVPRVSATFQHEGSVRRFIKGRTTIEEGNSILKGREHMVEPLRIDYPAPVKKQQRSSGSGSSSGKGGSARKGGSASKGSK